jgi:hypothetical protein
LRLHTLVVTCIACSCAGCIPIPIHHDVPTKTETTTASSENIDELKLAPFYHKSIVKDFEEELIGVSNDIEIVESADVWKYAFPDREPDSEATLAELTSPETLNLLKRLNLQSAIILNPPTSSSGEDHFLFLGAAFGGSEEHASNMSALVIDIENAMNPERLKTSAEGKSRAAWVFIPLPLINFFYWDFEADTEGSAKGGLAAAFTERLVSKYKQRPVRIVVLGVLSDSSRQDTTDRKQTDNMRFSTTSTVYGLNPEQLEWRASLGDSDAQLQLYWNLTTPERLLWLCRSADQEQPEAQKRLGILYANGLEGVSIDSTWAYVWYSKASSNGDYWSGESADRISSRLNEQDSALARKRLDTWEPGQCKSDLQPIWETNASPASNDQDTIPRTP